MHKSISKRLLSPCPIICFCMEAGGEAKILDRKSAGIRLAWGHTFHRNKLNLCNNPQGKVEKWAHTPSPCASFNRSSHSRWLNLGFFRRWCDSVSMLDHRLRQTSREWAFGTAVESKAVPVISIAWPSKTDRDHARREGRKGWIGLVQNSDGSAQAKEWDKRPAWLAYRQASQANAKRKGMPREP